MVSQANISPFAVTFLAALTISQSLTPAAQANGGRNGPDTSGTSIPIQVDHSISEDEVVKATLTCAIRLKKSLYQQIYRRDFPNDQVFEVPKYSKTCAVARMRDGSNPRGGNFCAEPQATVFNPAWVMNYKNADGSNIFRNMMTKSYTADTLGSTFSTWTILKDGSYAHYHKLSNERDIEGQAIPETIKEYPILELLIGVVASAEDSVQVTGSFIFPIPYFSYKAQVSEPVFDDYGAVISARRIVSNLVLVLPKEHGPAVRLTRTETGGRGFRAPTKLTANTEAYANCLIKELNP